MWRAIKRRSSKFHCMQRQKACRPMGMQHETQPASCKKEVVGQLIGADTQTKQSRTERERCTLCMHTVFWLMKQEEMCVCLFVWWWGGGGMGGFLHIQSTSFSPESLKITDCITGDNRTVVCWLDVNHNNTGQANHDSLIKCLMTRPPWSL